MDARPKILHADDEEGWRELTGFWLTSAGYEVRAFEAGKGVLALAREFRPDCFLLDHDLGDTTGRELCRAIKSTVDFSAIPVIVMTAHAEALPEIVAEFPPDQFIAKSNEPDELLLVLAELLGGQAFT
jgi:CheY-like chemotaxis protein